MSVYPVLTSIKDKNNVALLTFTRDGNNAIAQVSDRYGRSVYYHVGSYQTTGVPLAYTQSVQALDHVSQVVPTGTASPPDRHVFGYQNVSNGESSEAIPMLHTVTTPSATGTGTQTATISYLPGLCTVSSVTDGNGNTRSYNQTDANHTQVNVTDAQSNVVYRYTAGYDMNLSVTSITNGKTDVNGSNTQVIASMTYADANDPLRPSEVQDANGYQSGGAGGQGTTNKTWDQFGNCLTMTSARGTTTTLSYNYTNFALGEMTSVQEGTKTPTTFTYYEPSGLIHTMTRPAPGSASNPSQTVSYSYTYDALGNLLSASEPGNNATSAKTTTYNYTQDGGYSQAEMLHKPLTLTDSLGHVTHLRYDTRGNETAILDAVGNETDLTYNTANQQTSLTFAATGETGTGRAQLVNMFLYPGGPKTSVSQYNEAGTQVFQEQMTYGKEGEPLTRTGSTQPVTQAYDGLYRLKTLTDGNSHNTTYSYGTSGYLSQISYPNGDILQVTSYDLNGNPLQRIDGRGVVTNLTYNDIESRLTDIAYPASTALNVHVSYDGYGRKTGITDGSGSQSVVYDDRDKPISVTTTYTGLAAKTLNYAYYPDGSRQTLTLPDATSYMDTYDAAGRHTGLSSPSGHSFSWTYANNNWLTSQTSDNTIVTTPTRDARGFITDLTHRRTDISHTLLSDFALTYASNMTLGSMTSTVSGVSAFSGTTTYAHDTKLQLTQESSNRAGGYVNNNAYDGAGNPTTFKGATQTFNNANQNTAYTYDGNGNPTAYKGNTLAFDVENRLTAYGSVLTAGYRADGQRAWKQNSGGKTYYFYDGDKLLYETNSTGTITAKNVWADTGLLARSTSTPNRTLLYTWDAQGNVSQQLDASTGSIVESYMFDAFGTRATNGTDTAAMNDPYAGYSGREGYYQDVETGLLLLSHRYCDPTTGRFLNRDPIDYDGGVNLYEYVNNSPLSGHDASGFSEDGSGQSPLMDCLADAIKLLYKFVQSPSCGEALLCQFALNCVTGMICSTMIETDCTFTPNPLQCGCIIGAICSAGHTYFDHLCNEDYPCKHSESPWWCDLIVNTGSGCVSGALTAIGCPICGAAVGGLIDGWGESLCEPEQKKADKPH